MPAEGMRTASLNATLPAEGFLLPRTVIIANGPFGLNDLAAARRLIAPTDRLIAADGGAAHCRALGLTPHVLIGDFDSVPPDELAALENAGAQVIRHPVRKDQTDLELALDLALRDGADDILILAALGGRWDQTLANVFLLARPGLDSARVRLADGKQQITLLRGPGQIALDGQPGDTVSLIPIGGDARGMTTTGLEYPLKDGMLKFGSTRGASNALVEAQATVALQEGLLVCVLISSTED